MEALSKIHYRPHSLHLSIDQNRSSFSRPVSSIFFRRTPSSSWSLPSTARLSLVRAASTNTHLPQNPKNPKASFFETLKPLVRTACVAAVAAALFLARPPLKLAFAAPAATAEPADVIAATPENEKRLEEYVESHRDDVPALRNLMEIKVKTQKLDEAVHIMDRLIALEPKQREWPLMKGYLHNYAGNTDLAAALFEELLAQDSLCAEAYHGLVISASQSGGDLDGVLERIEKAMERCRKENRKEDARDFKLLIAQARVLEGRYAEALKVYEQLVKEEPRDFRPYLCQGIIYRLLRNNDEAEKHFEKYRRLVPKGHPYAEFFNENMLAANIFSPDAGKSESRF